MNSSLGPYAAKPEAKWGAVTQGLLARHPLKLGTILEVATAAWDDLWHTTVGAGRAKVQLTEVAVPAAVVGYFFGLTPKIGRRSVRRRAKWRDCAMPFMPTSW